MRFSLIETHAPFFRMVLINKTSSKFFNRSGFPSHHAAEGANRWTSSVEQPSRLAVRHRMDGSKRILSVKFRRQKACHSGTLHRRARCRELGRVRAFPSSNSGRPFKNKIVLRGKCKRLRNLRKLAIPATAKLKAALFSFLAVGDGECCKKKKERSFEHLEKSKLFSTSIPHLATRHKKNRTSYTYRTQANVKLARPQTSQAFFFFSSPAWNPKQPARDLNSMDQGC